jgi:putative ABC transport system permease protein
MLYQFLNSQIAFGALQAVLAALLALAVMVIARWQEIHLEREIVTALLRGAVQIVVVGSVLVLLLKGPNWTSIFILAGMMLAAATIAARRARGIPGAFRISLYGIVFGAGATIALMTLVGVIDSSISSLVPVGSMIIATAMNTNGLALDRFRAEVVAHVGQVEAGLSLGAAPTRVVTPYVRAAVRASLIPGHRLDTRVNGRDGAGGQRPGLCCYLPVCGYRDDFRFIQPDFVDEHLDDSQPDFLSCRTTDAAAKTRPG